MKFIKNDTNLFVWAKWKDTRRDIRMTFHYARDDVPNFATDSISYFEDQFALFFKDVTNDNYDVWNWRAYTTDPVNLAEDSRYINDTIQPDASGKLVAWKNNISGARPQWVHHTGPAFTGEVLFKDQAIYNPWFDSTQWEWEAGDTIHGYYIDSVEAHQGRQDQTDSRWEIDAKSAYNATTKYYTLIMSRKLNTGHSSDDLNMTDLDSVVTRIFILDNKKNVNLDNSSQQGSTDEIVLKLKN